MMFAIGDTVQLGDYTGVSDYQRHKYQTATVTGIRDGGYYVDIQWHDGTPSVLFRTDSRLGDYAGATVVKYEVGDRVAYHPEHYDNDLTGTVVAVVTGVPTINFDNGTLRWVPPDDVKHFVRIITKAQTKVKQKGLGTWELKTIDG